MPICMSACFRAPPASPKSKSEVSCDDSSRGSNQQVSDLSWSGPPPQAQPVPQRHQAREHSREGERGEDRGLWAGEGDGQPATLHRVHFDSMVVCHYLG